jgi:hypothetical protein
MLQAQNTNLPVGAIPGAIDVSPMGAATYTIPIEVVPGTMGVQPNLSIVYNSFGGMGLLGMKWNLAGLSAITRCGQTPYFDGYLNYIPIQFDINRFTLDGERLINIGGQQQDIIYASEVENFTRIYPENNHSNFTAYTDDGSIIEYGNTPDSKQKMENTENILSYCINKFTDANGNYMTFQYWKPQNDEEVLIQEIQYTGNAKTNMQPYATVHFNYTPLPDNFGVNTYFVAGYGIQQTKLLDAITVYYGSAKVREYKFIYNLTNTGDRTAYLKEIILFSENYVQQLNKTTINWDPQSNKTPNIPSNTPKGYIITGDFNGDGYTDYVIYGLTEQENKWELYEGNSDGTFENSGISGNHTSVKQTEDCYFYKADINDDGADELIIAELLDLPSKLYQFRILSIGDWVGEINKGSINNFYQLFFGDYSGTGTTDILFVKKNPNDPDKKCTFQLYKYNYFTNLSLNPNCECRVRVGDFSGNGKTDIELHFSGSPTGLIKTYYYNSSGQFSEFSTSEQRASFYCDRYSGDFNGDGITDLLTYTSNYPSISWNISFGKGDGTYTNPVGVDGLNTEAQSLSNSWIVPKYKIMIADLDGNGKDDIIQLTPNSSKILYSKGCIVGNYGVCTYINKPDNISISTELLQPGHFNISDLNNDGILDLIYQTNRNNVPKVVYVNNKLYDFSKKITDGLGKTIELTYQPKYLPANEFNLSQSMTKKYFHYVLNKMYVSNGLGSLNTFEYQYEEPVFSMQRMAFLGFEKFFCKNVQENKEDVYEYKMLMWGNGYYDLFSKEVLTPSFHTVFYDTVMYSITNYRMTLTDLGSKRYAPHSYPTISYKFSKIKIRIRNILNEKGRQIETETKYGAEPYREQQEYLILTETKYYTYKTIAFNGNQEKTVPEKIILEKKYDNSSQIIFDTLTYNYFETGAHKGLLNWERHGTSDGSSITSKYNSYTPTGLCLSKTVSAAGCASRTENYEYDNTQRFITQITNPVGHITKYPYDEKKREQTL